MRIIATAIILLVAFVVPGHSCPIDPSASDCTFPSQPILCSESFSIDVVASCALGPALGAVVWVEYLEVTGDVDLPSGDEVVSDAKGLATLEFPAGLSGEGSLRFEIWADGIPICVSDVYSVERDCSVATEPTTWGSIKQFLTRTVRF